MNILIAGGAGFIGSHTADALIEAGHRVRILDNLQRTVHPGGKPDYLNPKAEFLCADVREKAAWKKALVDIDAVYHFAAYQDYLTDFSTFFHVNAVSTALLYEVIVEENLCDRIRRVIVASSQAVMGEGRYACPECHRKTSGVLYPQIRTEAQLKRGEWEHRCPVCRQTLRWLPSDESVIFPCNQYALSKHSQEQITCQLGMRYAVPSVALRYSIVQGPRQSFYNAYSGAMRIFSLSLYTNRPPVIFEDGEQVRDFVNIQDVVDANLLVLSHPEAVGRVFNVGGDRPWTINEFYETMQAVIGKRLDPVMSGQYRFGDTRHIFSDISGLKALGWHPKRTVKDSILSYWQYLQDRNDTANILEFAEKQMKRLNVIRDSEG